jgi:Na+/glutamate symporter
MVFASQSADQFALKYRGCGIVGLLACLHILGEFSHEKLFKYKPIEALGSGCPSSLVAGVIGLILLVIMKELLGLNFLVDNCRDQLHEMVRNIFLLLWRCAIALNFLCGVDKVFHVYSFLFFF